MESVIPKFQLTDTILSRMASVTAQVGHMEDTLLSGKNDYIRIRNRDRSIIASLKLAGRLDLFREESLKEVHRIMTRGENDAGGVYRKKGNEAIRPDGSADQVPSAEGIPEGMVELFRWMKESENVIHPLLLSTVFHCSLVALHPFHDGNGRLARFWQGEILSCWKPYFRYAAIDEKLAEDEAKYRNILETCQKEKDATLFLEYLLELIDRSLGELAEAVQVAEACIPSEVQKLFSLMEEGRDYTKEDLLKVLPDAETGLVDYAVKLGALVTVIPEEAKSGEVVYRKR